MARLAGHLDRRNQLHRDAPLSQAPAGAAHSFDMIEAEVAGKESAHLGFGKRGKKDAQGGKKIDIGADIGPLGVADGILVDDKEFMNPLYSRDAGAFEEYLFGFWAHAKGFFEGGLKEVVQQGWFPRPRAACGAGERS